MCVKALRQTVEATSSTSTTHQQQQQQQPKNSVAIVVYEVEIREIIENKSFYVIKHEVGSEFGRRFPYESIACEARHTIARR